MGARLRCDGRSLRAAGRAEVSRRAEVLLLCVVAAGLVWLQVATGCAPQPQPSPSPTAQPSATPTPAELNACPAAIPDVNARGAWAALPDRTTFVQETIKRIAATIPAALASDSRMVEELRVRGYCAYAFNEGIAVRRALADAADDDPGLNVWEEHRPTASWGGWRSKTFCDECSLWKLQP